ncbi:hypothetical protein [Flaviaesturariibacter amylovorans]|uniref:CDP-glycerol glycerophosphotransferase family protein n=1 Tax=Flaviaesturariibacter amylovorans TaxID=1084520 RepID=A0ABP8GDQ4_9BACT
MTILYIDPGSGALLISALAGLGFTLLYFLKGLFYKVSYLFLKKEKVHVKDLSNEIVFFSEGKNYWKVFQPVVEELVGRKQKVVYLTADKQDAGLALSSEYYSAHYLGDIRQSIYFLNRLKARLCIMTTPQLDVIALRRSRNVKHYSHLIHSPTDIHAYKKFAFDYFDSVLCSSTAQISNLRFLEQERNTKPKQLFETGCTYYDVFKAGDVVAGESILLAPTWGDRTFFKSCGKQMLRYLLEAGHKVILRPHPQSWISDKPLMNEILAEFEAHPNLTIDRSVSSEKAISSSNVLICDITSGMVYDMAFMHRKPVVAVEFDWADGGYEASDLARATSARDLLQDIGGIVHATNIEAVSETVNLAAKKTVTQEIIDKHIFNFRKSGKIAADQVMSIYNQLA